MINWVNVYEKKDFKYLLKRGNKVDRMAVRVYEAMEDELVDKHGVGDVFLKILKNKIKISLMKADQVLTGDKSSEIKIKILEAKIDELEIDFKEVNIYDTIISIEKALGFKLDLQKITVSEFYKYANFVKKLR